ncbi:MAG: glycosyltransferase family 39 protein, partial [Anaerolineae bacterium]|nr:glycosyltransferase family 39 protein [Anaerolineae bacterium]
MKPIRKTITTHPQAVLVLLAFVGLAVIYSLVTPPFEAGDESRHYAVVKYMADTGRLPVQNIPATREAQIHWSHEGNQPPLYYALAALLTAGIETGSWDDVFWYNPHTTIGNPLRPDNKNITIHPPGESWPWRNHVLAVHLIRFMSISMAAVTVVAAYAIAHRLFRGRRWLAAGAMAVTAFNPMFIFISAAVNNDNAVIMFVTLALWLMVIIAEQANRPNTTTLSRRMPYLAALLGLLIGLGALSKLYTLGLLPLAIILFIWVAYKTNNRPNPHPSTQSPISNLQSPVSPPPLSIINYQLSITWIAIFGAVFLAVAGWFYLRNALIYNGDLFALQVMRETAGQRREAPTLATLKAEFEGFRIAYWALFGGVNILVSNWIYTLLDWLALIAFIGLLAYLPYFAISLWKNKKPATPSPPQTPSNAPTPLTPQTPQTPSTLQTLSTPTFLILLSWSAIMVAGFIVWNLTQPAGQGRLLYPAIAAISALGMHGLTWWLPSERIKNGVAGTMAVGLFLFAAITPFVYIAPAYAKPPILTQTDIPEGIQPVNFTYDNAVELIGYQLHTPTVRPAETVDLTLYWQILKPTDLDYSIFVHLLGRERQVVGQIDTYPGGGQWPTTLLKPGDIVADTYHIPVTPDAEYHHAPTRLQIAAGIYDFFEPGRPGRPAVNAAGEPVEPIIAAAKLVPWQWPDPPQQTAPVEFIDKARLLSYHLADDQQELTLNWQAESDFETDYTVFIQAWNAATGDYATGFDGPPVQGNYPTSLWSPGEVIVDAHS